MKSMITAVAALMLIVAPAMAQNYSIDWYVIASGGGHSQSSSYALDGTIGQPATGLASSSNYSVGAGFWYGFIEEQGGCAYVPGDVNGNLSVNVLDVTYLVNYLAGQGPTPPDSCPCPVQWLYAAADVNGNCSVNVLDVTYLVNYLAGQGQGPAYCQDCPPGPGGSPGGGDNRLAVTPSLKAKSHHPSTGLK